MGVEKDYGDRPVHEKGLLEAVNRTIVPIGRLVRARVNAMHSPAFTTTIASGRLFIDWTAHRHYRVDLTANVTSVVFTNTADFGADFFIRFRQTGAFTVTGWPSTVHWVGGVRPTITQVAGRTDIFKLFYDGSNYWTEVSQNFV